MYKLAQCRDCSHEQGATLAETLLGSSGLKQQTQMRPKLFPWASTGKYFPLYWVSKAENEQSNSIGQIPLSSAVQHQPPSIFNSMSQVKQSLPTRAPGRCHPERGTHSMRPPCSSGTCRRVMHLWWGRMLWAPGRCVTTGLGQEPQNGLKH